MLTVGEVHNALYALQALNMNYQVQGQAEFWTPILNAAVPEMTIDVLRRAVEALGSGQVKTARNTVQPADLIRAATFVMHGDPTQHRERLRQEIATGGQFIPEGLTDPTATLEWQQKAVEVFLSGATRNQAENAAWEHIGQERPKEITKTRKINFNKIGRNKK